MRWRTCFRALRTAEIANVLGEFRKDRVIRNNKIFPNVAVWRDDAINAYCLKGSIGTGASGNPTNEHDVPVGRVLDRLGSEVGNEVAMSGRAIAGTLASTRSLLGLSHVFPQSSIL